MGTTKIRMVDILIGKGLKLVESHDAGAELMASHSFDEVRQVFRENKWNMTFNGSVGGGVRMASFEEAGFGGGKAVLHFEGEKIYYVTLSFARNYYD